MTCAECTQDKQPREFFVDNTRPRGRVARCKTCYSAKQKVDRNTKPRRRFLEAKRNAKTRGLEWRLTFDQFVQWLWLSSCFYCGSTETICGIDRLNNEPYYDMSNTVACCATCNGMKSKQPLHVFLEQVKRIAVNLGMCDIANASIALKGQF